MHSKNTTLKSVIEYVDGGGHSTFVPAIEFEDIFSVPLQYENVHGDHERANDVQFTHQIIQYMRGSIKTISDDGDLLDEVRGPLGYPPLFVSDIGAGSPVAYNKAMASHYDKVREQVDWAVNILQARQTAGLGGSVLRLESQLIRLVNHVKRFRPTDLKKWYAAYKRRGSPSKVGDSTSAALRELGNRWLEYIYGIKPLCQDIHDTVASLNRGASKPLTVGGRGSDIDEFSVLANWNYNGYTYPMTGKVKRSRRCQIIGRYKIPDSAILRLADFTSLSPASIAWEMIPYSFVVDWVYNVGGYLRDLETSMMYERYWLDGYMTITEKVDVECDVLTVLRLGGGLRKQVILTGGTNSMRYKLRTKARFAPLPRLPVVDVKLGSGRLLNAAALLSQFLGRR